MDSRAAWQSSNIGFDSITDRPNSSDRMSLADRHLECTSSFIPQSLLTTLRLLRDAAPNAFPCILLEKSCNWQPRVAQLIYAQILLRPWCDSLTDRHSLCCCWPRVSKKSLAPTAGRPPYQLLIVVQAVFQVWSRHGDMILLRKVVLLTCAWISIVLMLHVFNCSDSAQIFKCRPSHGSGFSGGWRQAIFPSPLTAPGTILAVLVN